LFRADLAAHSFAKRWHAPRARLPCRWGYLSSEASRVADRPRSNHCTDTSLSFAVMHVIRVSSCSTIYLAGNWVEHLDGIALSVMDGSNNHVLNGAVLALGFAGGRHCQWSRSAKPGSGFCSVIYVGDANNEH
jgi:hypothetical protein